jgi:hypothetical protein
MVTKKIIITDELKQRFWKKVRKGDGCWEWQGVRFCGAYGAVSTGAGASYYMAHRASFAINYGPPDGYSVCHLCDNPGCVRPDHLAIGTQSDNGMDASRKKRLGKYRVQRLV